MIVKIIEVIEVTDYEVRTSDCGRTGEASPVKRYFLRDGTPLEVPTPSAPMVSTYTITMDPCDPNIYATKTN